jgi:hypothetical protein
VRKAKTHEASASLAGYLFQCRFALLAGLQAIADRPQLEISIEKFDDVAFEEQGEPVQLVQTKHHLKRTGNLGDASVDLWKTLHIWTRLVAKDVAAPFRVQFVLLTTGSAPSGSAASERGMATAGHRARSLFHPRGDSSDVRGHASSGTGLSSWGRSL